jgi:hypothetical protein
MRQGKVTSITDAASARTVWTSVFTPRLDPTKKIWAGSSAYATAATYMVPLHAAFMLEETTWQAEMKSILTGYMAEPAESVTEGNLLNHMQFLCFASRYAVLSTRTTRDPNDIPGGLIPRIYKFLTDYWNTVPIKTWDNATIFTGVKARLAYKMSLKNPAKSYYRAVLDAEVYMGAIASDLLQYDRLIGGQPKLPGLTPPYDVTVLKEIRDKIIEAWKPGVDYNNIGGWVFQKHVWDDHPDHAYAGQTTMTVGMEKKKYLGTGEDTSHCQRYPLFLRCFMESAEAGSAERNYFVALLKGLEKQFYTRVLVKPNAKYNAYLTTNFLDGWNGVYRWNYAYVAKDTGYGPYDLSGTFLTGWWIFLGTPRITKAHAEMLKLFPLSDDVVNIYYGAPGPNANPSSIANDKLLIKNATGMRALVVYLAAKIGAKIPPS